MRSNPGRPSSPPGVSIITCTNRASFIHTIFRNYSRQLHAKKELIIVINSSRIPLSVYRNAARKYPHVHVFRLSERYTLGACLNYAVKRSRYPYIAKFDDDDYYAPYYLTDSLQAFKRTGADIVGKRAHYMVLRGSKALLLRFAQDENRYVDILPGATLVMKRKVFRSVSFPNQSVGEDDGFCMRSRKRGFKIYSASKFNFVAIRRKNSHGHTWIISDQTLLAHHKRIRGVTNIPRFISRMPKVVPR
ncbi:glycosyltransferase [Gorillibacterium timonense]|uniref:glycosyltransferase n=1 Tax=Gorillibacterium timonense TaxID=1689269 RepID=UPI00071C67DC|nr:glycosyltransferase [Gorillibacterium timonense]